MSKSELEREMGWQIRVTGLPAPVEQFRAIPGRQFTWDYAWPDRKLLLEVQGGVWNGGKHGRGSGILRDQEKLNLATIHGWRILQVSENHITDGRAMLWLKQALAYLPPT